MAKKKKSKSTGAPPICNCCLLCDDVMTSSGRGKQALQGIINGLNTPDLPVNLATSVVYIRLTNVRPVAKDTLTLELTHSADPDCVVMSGKINIEGTPDPFGVCTLVLPLKNLVFPLAGRYLLQVAHNGDPLAQTPIVVKIPESLDEETE